jgi:hypothetical protein
MRNSGDSYEESYGSAASIPLARLVCSGPSVPSGQLAAPQDRCPAGPLPPSARDGVKAVTHGHGGAAWLAVRRQGVF